MLLISEILWSRMLDELEHAPRDVERVAYLDGVRLGDVATVTTVTIPNATLRRGNYHVGAGAIAESGHALRRNGLVRLAQVHTHPTEWVDHSPTDDEMAYSQRAGSISIVLPYHAHRRPDPGSGGVHVRDRSGWRRLSPEDAGVLVRLVPSVLDFRSPRPRTRRRWWPWSA